MNGKIYRVLASLNEGCEPKEYIAIENENGILLIDNGLFVFSVNKEEEIPVYKRQQLVVTI